MDISGGDRLLFHCRDNAIYLIAMGGHEVVERYKNSAALETELRNGRALPPAIQRLARAGFFTFDVEAEWQPFANEADPSWLTYLDTQQMAAVNRVLKRLDDNASNPKSWCFSLIVGGPGTGKTSILLNLFCRAFEKDIIPQVVMQDQVVSFVRDAGGVDLGDYRVDLQGTQLPFAGGLLLVDDPSTFEEIRRAKMLAQMREFRGVIVAVDPLQLESDTTDYQLSQLVTGHWAETIELSTCYRQKKVVGEAAKKSLDTIADSSPFFREDKKANFRDTRLDITRVSNNLTFSNPSGRAKVYAAATLNDVQAEVSKLRRAPGLWKHTNPFLVAQDDEMLARLPSGWKASLEQLGRVTWVKMGDAPDVKGIEFQHAILILSEALFLQLENGFEGATRALYHRRRLYRIPLSRAKDSIIVFVVPPKDAFGL